MPDQDYFFPLEPIPRLSCKDPRALQLIANEKPVVLIDANLCDAALKWNLTYLEEHIGTGNHAVFASPTNNFKYYDEVKARQFSPDFVRPTQRLEMSFQEFAKKVQQWKPGDKRLYLQQGLNSSVGPVIASDFISFNWAWLTAQQKALGWGALTSNLLLVGMAGNVTPVHYDEQQNFFCQLHGEKHCILFSPDHHDRLYPHPIYHPHDRQSQVDLHAPDFGKFPGLRQLKGFSTVLRPGETLHIPIYWWHHITSLDSHPYTVSVNFWYKGAATDSVKYPLLPRQNVAIMRNIEKMIMDALKDPSEVNLFFQSLVLGRYTSQDAHLPSELSTSLMSRASVVPHSDEVRLPHSCLTAENVNKIPSTNGHKSGVNKQFESRGKCEEHHDSSEEEKSSDFSSSLSEISSEDCNCVSFLDE